MQSKMKDCSSAKHSNTDATSDYESVDLLFGLNPKEVYFNVGYFFDNPRTCGTAVADMISEALKQGDEREDNTVILGFLEGVHILTDIEKMHYQYEEFANRFPSHTTESVNPYEKSEEALCLHEQFVSVVRKIDQFGFCEFTEHITGAVSYIQTKTAYEDMVTAFGCAVNLYMACKANLWKNKSKTWS
ncbi:MAG: hypothetical protein LBL57_04095 [Tannerella sp.]|jgi:hypothetical protein|nr:hypothetical protein [Tannerella sp.]